MVEHKDPHGWFAIYSVHGNTEISSDSKVKEIPSHASRLEEESKTTDTEKGEKWSCVWNRQCSDNGGSWWLGDA